MQRRPIGPEIEKSALLIVDMQNDFLHRDGSFAHVARENPEAKVDIPFLTGTIPHVKKLIDAFRAAGRPVVYIAHVLKSDYSDATWPWSRRAATARTVWKAPGEPKSSMSYSPMMASI